VKDKKGNEIRTGDTIEFLRRNGDYELLTVKELIVFKRSGSCAVMGTNDKGIDKFLPPELVEVMNPPKQDDDIPSNIIDSF
jgi:hypothetical protein